MCATPHSPRPPSPLLCHLPACTLTLSRCAPIFYVAARAPPPPRPPRCTPPRSLLPFSAAVPRRVGVGVVGRRRVVTRDDRVHAGAAGLLPPFTAASRCAPLAACAELSPSCRMVISFFLPSPSRPVYCTDVLCRVPYRTRGPSPPRQPSRACLGSSLSPVSPRCRLASPPPPPCPPPRASPCFVFLRSFWRDGIAAPLRHACGATAQCPVLPCYVTPLVECRFKCFVARTRPPPVWCAITSPTNQTHRT